MIEGVSIKVRTVSNGHSVSHENGKRRMTN